MQLLKSAKAGGVIKALYCCLVTAYFYCIDFNVFFVYMDTIFAALGSLLFLGVWVTSQRGSRDRVWASVLFLIFLTPVVMAAYAMATWAINGFAP